MRLILIRGLGRDSLHWAPLLEALQAEVPQCVVETPDLPGTGELYQNTPPAKVEDYIPILRQQLSNNESPAVVAGLSLGGMLALTWGALEPEKILHSIAINSSSNLTSFYRRLQVYRAWQQPGILARWSPRTKEEAIYNLTCNKRPMPDGLLDEWTAIQERHPVSADTQLRQLYAAAHFNPQPLNKVSIFYSEGDKFVDPQCSRDLANFYQVDPQVHSWAGHDLTQDDPEWVAKHLAKVLRESFVDIETA